MQALLASQLQAIAHTPPSDAKNDLQMWGLEHHRILPNYQSLRSGGSDHAPEFTSTVSIGEQQATATGPSRRKAEANAAAALLSKLALHEGHQP